MIKQLDSQCRKDTQTKTVNFILYSTGRISRAASPVISDVVENPVAAVYHGHHHSLNP